MKVLIVGDEGYKNAFLHLKPDMEFEFAYMDELLTEDILDDIDLVCFTGGEDVDPSGYGEEKHESTYSNIARDDCEANFFQRVLSKKLPMVGICRGSQFLTVMNGGKLVQDVSNHAIGGTHQMQGILPPGSAGGGKVRWEFPVTSTHHQMMYPFNLPLTDYEVVGWASSLSDQYEGAPGLEADLCCFSEEGEVKDGVIEPEVVYYPNTRCLAVQYHPEYMSIQSTGVQWFQQAIRCYLFDTVNY